MIKKNLLSLLACFFILFLSGQQVSVQPAPQWLFKINENISRKPDTKNISDGYYLQLYNKQISIETQTDYIHVIRVIENDNGVQNASEVSVSFVPQYQQVLFHHLNVVRNGKIVSSVQLKQIRVVEEETSAEDFQYNEMKRAFVVLKDVRKGDKIDFAYSLKGFNPAYLNIFSNEIYFSNGTEVVNFYATIIANAGQKINFKTYNEAEAPQIISKNGLVIYHWKNPVLLRYEPLTGTPTWFSVSPYAIVTAFSSWAEVGKWALNLFREPALDVSPEIRQLVAIWKKESGNDKQTYVTKAVRFVQDEIRYLGLEIGANTHIPYGPAKVFNQRYGDCKDKSLLLTVLLRMNGINAYVSLVNTVYGKILDQKIPSQLEFDHAIVAVESSSGVYKFIDPTTSYQRGRAYETFTSDYGFALLVKEGVDKLTPIESGPKKFTSIEERIHVFSKGAPSLLTIQSTYEGGAADYMRYDLNRYSNIELRENYTNYYSRYYDSVVMDKDIESKDDSVNNSITVLEQYSIPELWKKGTNGRDEFTFFAKTIYDLFPNPEQNYKKGPLAIKYPEQIFYKVKLAMPSNWPVKNDQLHVKNASYQFDFEIYGEEDSVFLEYRFISFKDHIPLNEMENYKLDYNKMVEVMQYDFYQGTENGEKSTENNDHPSWIPIMLLVISLVGAGFLFRVFNRKSAPILYHPRLANKLSGWVVLLGISLLIGWFVNMYSAFTDTFFTVQEWKNLNIVGGRSLQLFVIVELIFSFATPLFSTAVIYWYFNRRDIFPRMFTGYAIFLIVSQALILFSLGWVEMGQSLSSVADLYTRGITRSLIYGAIWITFVYRSENVKQTFVFPYLYDSQEEYTDGTEGIEPDEAGSNQEGEPANIDGEP